MKKLFKKMLSKTKSFSILDYSVLKAGVFFFGLWIATIMPIITNVNPRIYGIARSVLYIYLIWKMFKKN